MRARATRYLAAGGLALAGVLAMALPASAALCFIGTTGVSFGSYSVFTTTPLDSTGSVSIFCIGDASVTVALDRGGAPSFNPRRMLQGTEALNYNLYLDAARTKIWGDGTGGSQVYVNTDVPNLRTVPVTIFGRIPAQQDVSAGSYSNSITATINF